MRSAARKGYIDIVALCKEYGATNFNEAMVWGACGGHIDIVKLCRGWLGYDLIYHDLMRHHHRREFSRRIHDELLPIAWHPDRVFNWCFDEGEKRFLESMWQTQNAGWGKSSEINGGNEVCRKLDVAIRSTFEMEERRKAIV